MKIKTRQLYVILDKKSQKAKSFLETAKAAIAGGADVLQLRDKELSTKALIEEGKLLRELTHRTQTLFIVNDRVDVALAVQADGIHLGQEDLPVAIARQILPANALIGKSTHSLQQALQAEREGVDYIGVGPIFATPTKPTYTPVGLQLIEEVSQRIKIPFVAIGGIDTQNIYQVLERCATNIAVVRAVVGAQDIERAARCLKTMIQRFRIHN